MRRLLAGLAALAVVLGLCLISVGTASAAPCDTPGSHRNGDGQFCGGAGLNLDLKATAGVDIATTADRVRCPDGQHHDAAGLCVPNGVGDPACTVDHNPRVPGCQNSGPIYGGHGYPGTWGGPRIDGRYLWLDQNLSLDVCSDSTYGGWYNRYSSHRDGFLRLLGGNPNARWMQLHSSSCTNQVSVSNDGQCVTYRQDALRYGNDLNANRRDWSGLRLRLLSSHHGWNGSDLSLLSLGERNDWNRLSGLDRQRFDNYNRVYSQLRTVCNDPNPQVVILQAPAAVTYAAPAADPSASGNDGASKPLASAPLNSALPAPSVAPSNGGVETAFVLAHARAV